jgi:murein DD-endopeptidase MepM/ murein hydrolase activator NlpD
VRPPGTAGALLLLAPLLLLGASLPRDVTAPSPSPAASPAAPADGPKPDPTFHDSIAPGYWLALLDAPPTSGDYRPGTGLPLLRPTRGVETQPFGCTNFGLEPTTANCPGGFHYGVDLADPQGVPIQAAADGIAYPLPDYQFYGNHVLIQHAGGLSTVYAHMVRMNVAWGQPVKRGDLIGWVGTTGNSTGPHLHFEVRFAGVPVDPLPYLEGSPAEPFPLPAGWPGMAPDDNLGLS